MTKVFILISKMKKKKKNKFIVNDETFLCINEV